MYVRRLIKWDLCGKNVTEEYINSIVPSGEYRKLDSETINEILEIKGYPLRVLDGKDLYLYYNLHPSSGYDTYIYIGEDEKIHTKIYRREGFSLNAAWSEVIIFDIVD